MEKCRKIRSEHTGNNRMLICRGGWTSHREEVFMLGAFQLRTLFYRFISMFISFFCRFTHLQHLPFTYTIKVTNNKSLASRGTMRIFLAPKFDEKGNAFPFSELRLLMIEMDRFDLNCKERFSPIRNCLFTDIQKYVSYCSASWRKHNSPEVN